MNMLGDLIAALNSSDPDIRISAADGLGQYGAYHEDVSALPTAVPHLAAALRDPVRGVRMSAAYALGAIGRAEALPEMIAALRDAPDDGGMQLVIVKALGKIGDMSALPVLVDLKDHGASRCVRIAAAKALAVVEVRRSERTSRPWTTTTPSSTSTPPARR